MKSVQIWSFFRSEYGKIWTRKNFVFGHFSPSDSKHHPVKINRLHYIFVLSKLLKIRLCWFAVFTISFILTLSRILKIESVTSNILSMMTSQILKFEDSSKTRKSRWLENETLFFLQIKKNHYIHINGDMAKNSFLVEVTFKRACLPRKYL